MTSEALSTFSKKLRDDPATRIKTKSTETLIGCAVTLYSDKDKAKHAAFLQELRRVVGVEEVSLDEEQEEERVATPPPPTTTGAGAQAPKELDPKESSPSNASVEDEIEVIPVPNPPTQGLISANECKDVLK